MRAAATPMRMGMTQAARDSLPYTSCSSASRGSPREARSNNRLQRIVAACREAARKHGRADRPPRHFHVATGGELRIPVELAESEHGESDGPQAEAPDARLAARDQQRVLERVAQVRVRDADEPVHAGAERIDVAARLELAQLEARFLEHVARKPAGIGAPVFPHVLQNVGHLQALAEPHGMAQQRLAMAIDGGRIVAEQLRQHLADDACDVVAVVVQLFQRGEAGEALATLDSRACLRT